MKYGTQLQKSGGALIVSVLSIAILAGTAAAVLAYVSSKYRNLSQATSWRKALVAAESGIDFSMQTLKDADADPSTAWTGWSTTNPTTGTTLPNNGKCYTGTALVHGGQGGTTMNFFTVVDAPSSLGAGGRTRQYYRIRSTGYADLAGAGVVTNDALDVGLRKLSLRKDRKTGQAVAKPRASRTIEVVAAPETELVARNVAHVKWDMQNYKNDTRAFDSSDPTYSTNGRWDAAKQVPSNLAGILMGTNQWHHDYEAKGTLEKVDLKNSSVWGDFAAAVGPVNNGGNIKGETLFGLDADLPKVLPPTWTTLTDPSLNKMEGSPNGVQKNKYTTWFASAPPAIKAMVDPPSGGKSFVLYGGSDASTPTTYKVTKAKADGNDKTIVFANPPGVTESWIEVWSTEEFKIKNGGTLLVEDGVHAKVHFEKLLKVKDTKQDNAGAIVLSGFAGDLQFYGVELPESSKQVDADFSAVKTSGMVNIEDSQFTGVIFAPDYDMQLKTKNSSYPATQQYILGAVTGRKVKFSGDTDFITDLAITESGKTITKYRIASWFEDSE